MMRDGLYKVAFETRIGYGAGVVVLNGGRLRGGDSGIAYVGTYDETGGQFTAKVTTNRHTTSPRVQSVFGIDRATISLHGVVHGDTAEMKGTAEEMPGVTFQATLTRIAD